jgi:hypothetical protein
MPDKILFRAGNSRPPGSVHKNLKKYSRKAKHKGRLRDGDNSRNPAREYAPPEAAEAC